MIRGLMALFVALALLAPAAACTKKAKKKSEEPIRVDPTERRRGLKACKAYVERVCRCAVAKPAFKKACNEAESHKESLDMMFATMVSNEVENRGRIDLIKSARKTIETCFSAMARMDRRLCPVK